VWSAVRMKLVIFGLTVSSSWGNGHATLLRGLCRALAERGHSIVFFERDVPYYRAHRDLSEWHDGELILFNEWNDVLATAERQINDADVAMITSYCPDAIAATDVVLDSAVPMKTFYDLDTPVTLDGWRSGRTVAYLGPRGLGEFDLVLSYTGGEALTELRRLGARRVEPLYGSVDPDVHRRVPAHDVFRADLSYLGTYAADRQAALSELLMEPARQLPTKRFLIGGAQYPADFPWSENIFFVRHIEPGQHSAFYSSSRLTLNVTRAAMKQMGYCPSGRLFEAAACGTPILSDNWEGLDLFFAPGREIVVANNCDDAVRAIQLTDAELDQIARAARERTLAEHTATIRARQLEAMLETSETREGAATVMET
jgi:spore maturation protein CgeB